jgi:RHS repeat-associated protein
MLLPTAQRSLVRLLVVVLLASMTPPFSSHAVAATTTAPQYGPPTGLSSVTLARPSAATHAPASGLPPASFMPRPLPALTLPQQQAEDPLPPGRLLSRGKTPTVSSGASSARYATDDSSSTYSVWESAGTLPQWLQIAFTAPVTLTGTHIQWAMCGVLIDYTLGVSADGLTFTTVVSRTDVPSDFSNEWATDTFQAHTRFLRITVTDVRSDPEGFCGTFAEDESLGRIATFDVYGSSPLPPDQDNPPRECSCQGTSGGPFSTRTGALWTSTTDLMLPTDGPPLTFKRTYLSRTSDQNGALGYGWTHSFLARLIAPTASGGEAGRVKIISPDGNVDRFEIDGAAYTALPGIDSTLVQTGTTFIQTRRDQSRAVYDATTGRLMQISDAQGRALDLAYDVDDQLISVQSAQVPSRTLTLTYTVAGQIDAMSDGIRTARYAYTNGDLTGVTDVMSRTTTYTYQNHVLTSIVNPLSVALERTAYDQYLPAGKVISQTLEDGRWLQVDYAANTTTITTTGRDGRVDIEAHGYTDDDTLDRRSHNGTTTAQLAQNEGFAPSGRTDARGGTTVTDYNVMGQPTAITDASGAQTATSYDAQSRPISMTDSLGRYSTMAYDASGNLIQQVAGITPQTPLGFTTVYTYNLRYPTKDWLEEQRGPDGVITSYSYDTLGQLTEMTVGASTSLAQTTGYAYDALGRVVATTTGAGTALARTDHTEYNADNTVARTIQNHKNGVFDSAHPDEDVITTHGYDALGRRIWTRDALGRYDITHYNVDGQVDWTVRNFSAPGWSGGNVQPASLPTYTPTAPAANVATLYGYDGLGRTAFVTQTGILTGTFDTSTLQFSAATSRVTKTEFDALSRPMTVTLNYRPDLPIGAAPDVNVQTRTDYDATGNLTGDGAATYGYDALGRMIVRGTTPYTYTGDGVLVQGGTTRYTQDLATPLSQVLQTTQGSTTTNYLYGLDRLAALAGSTRTWYVGDALGSVRLTLADSGAPLGVVHYDPWGTPESGTVPTFGFTGELQDAASGMVNLRARWYQTGQGRFVSRDPFEGAMETPYSLHPYQYGYADPVGKTDPSGWVVAGSSGACTITDSDCLRERTQLQHYGLDIENDIALCDWPLDELVLVRTAVEDLMKAAGWSQATTQRLFSRSSGFTYVLRRPATTSPWYGSAPNPTIELHKGAIDEKADMMKVTVVHELAHIWDFKWPEKQLSEGMKVATGGAVQNDEHQLWFDKRCLGVNYNITCKRPIATYYPGGQPASQYGGGAVTEDWAEAVAASVYPTHHNYVHDVYNSLWDRIIGNGHKERTMDRKRVEYVQQQFRNP